jgi:acyl carrier protein
MEGSMKEEILSIIAEVLYLEIGEISSELNLQSIDSLDYIEMIMTLEDEFGIEIPNEVAKKFETVQDIIEYIENEKRR